MLTYSVLLIQDGYDSQAFSLMMKLSNIQYVSSRPVPQQYWIFFITMLVLLFHFVPSSASRFKAENYHGLHRDLGVLDSKSFERIWDEDGRAFVRLVHLVRK